MSNQIPQNTLSLLMNTKIITHDMMEAGYRYAEICHMHPAGGPVFARAKEFQQTICPEKNLERLWHDLHRILKESPIKKTIEALAIDDDMEALSWVLENPAAHPFVRDIFSNMAFCLKSYGQL